MRDLNERLRDALDDALTHVLQQTTAEFEIVEETSDSVTLRLKRTKTMSYDGALGEAAEILEEFIGAEVAKSMTSLMLTFHHSLQETQKAMLSYADELEDRAKTRQKRTEKTALQRAVERNIKKPGQL